MIRVKSKKTIAILLMLILVLSSLVACGNKGDAGGSAGSSGDAPVNSSGKTMEEVLLAAADNITKADSLSYKINMDMGMTVFGMNMDTLMDADVKTIQEPFSMEMLGKMDMGDLGNYDMKIYAESDAEGITMYTGMEMDGETSWMKTKAAIDSAQISQYNAQSNIQVYMENAKNFKEVGEEEVEGAKTVRFDGTISGESIEKALEESGMSSQLETAGAEDAKDIYSEIGEIPVSFWVDTEKELIVKYTIDMSETIKNMMDKALEEAKKEGEEAAEMAGLFSMDRSIITTIITGINDVDAIVIPPEAIENAQDIDM